MSLHDQHKRIVTEFGISCSHCHVIKPLSEFHKDSRSVYGVAYYCKVCANMKSRQHNKARIDSGDTAYKEAKRNAAIRNKFGITLEEYLEKLKAQGYTCAICNVELPSSGYFTHLDHCHTTGKIRDFLCTNCNRGLGHFQDSIKNLNSAAEYLKTHQGDVT